MQKKGILERLKEGPVLGDGGYLLELEKRGWVRAGPDAAWLAEGKTAAVLGGGPGVLWMSSAGVVAAAAMRHPGLAGTTTATGIGTLRTSFEQPAATAYPVP